MAKNQAIIAPDFLGQLSMVYVTERLGIRPEQHQLTSEGAWIRLAERLMKTPASAKRRATPRTNRQGETR
jgi:hypothetical protein